MLQQNTHKGKPAHALCLITLWHLGVPGYTVTLPQGHAVELASNPARVSGGKQALRAAAPSVDHGEPPVTG